MFNYVLIYIPAVVDAFILKVYSIYFGIKVPKPMKAKT